MGDDSGRPTLSRLVESGCLPEQRPRRCRRAIAGCPGKYSRTRESKSGRKPDDRRPRSNLVWTYSCPSLDFFPSNGGSMSTLAPGVRLGPYEILAPADDRSETCKATDTRDNRTVAISL